MCEERWFTLSSGDTGEKRAPWPPTPITSLRGFAQALVRQHEKQGSIEPQRLNRALQVIDQQSIKLTRLMSLLSLTPGLAPT